MEKKRYITPATAIQQVQLESMIALSVSTQSFDADLDMEVKAGRSFSGHEGSVNWQDWGE